MDEILKESEEKINEIIPPGYVEIKMSTQGKYYAPKSFHMRNLDINEAFELGSISQEEMPVKILNILQNLIWEKDVKLKDFLEVEVTEVIIRFFVTFYQKDIKDQDFRKICLNSDNTDLNDYYKKWVLDNVYNGQETQAYKNWLNAVITGKTKILFDIDLTKVKFYPIDKVKKQVEYKKSVVDPNTFEKKDFKVVFDLPRFGDAATVQVALQEKFGNEDKKYRTTYNNYKYNQDLENRRRRGELVDSSTEYYIPEKELNEVKSYELRKISYTIDLMKGMYLHSIDDVDYSDKPLSERVEIAKNDRRIDYNCWQTISEEFQKVNVGPIPKVVIEDPITGGKSEIDYTFRTLDLLTNIKNYRSDNASVEYI